MSPTFQRGQADVAKLTRVGKLQEATAMIRSLLQRPAVSADLTDTPPVAAGDVIEVEFTRLNGKPLQLTAPQRKSGKTPLAETLRKIASGGMPARGPLTETQVPVAKGARFLSLSCGTGQSSRSHRLYVPAARPAG